MSKDLQSVLARLGVHGTDVFDDETSVPGNVQIYAALSALGTEKQLSALERCSTLGWEFKRLIIDDLVAVQLMNENCTCWVLPDGSLHRAPIGKKLCKLPMKWNELT